jgi:hypothetical protein
MLELLILFLDNLLPIALIAGTGFVVGKKMGIQPRTFSVVAYYIFNPCLVINTLIRNQLGGMEVLRMVFFACAVFGVMGLLAWAAGRALRLERKLLAATMITTIFMNSGNLGLPVNLFAFGETALAFASLYFVANFVAANTAGVMIASLGTTTPRRALINLLKVPTTYAVILGVLIVQQGWELPLPFGRAVDLLGNAAVPSMLVLLGLQFKEARWTGQVSALALTSSLRLIVSPIVAIGLAALFGLQGVARQAGILESAMPVAVLTTVLTTEYDAEPSFAAMCVFVTTLLSPLTLTPLMYWLGAR